ncbi:MAG: hypothetical protein IJ007_01980 [Oscillospiraceae bacterium]|nr:hypothetical protein [Oscillospiraceae bacterium]
MICTEENKLNWEEIRERNKKVPVKYDRDKLFEGLAAFVKDYAVKNGYDIVISDKVLLEDGEVLEADIAVGKFLQEDGKFKGTPVFVIEIQPVDVIYAVDRLKFIKMGLNSVKEYWVFNSHFDRFDTYMLDRKIAEEGRMYAEKRTYNIGSAVCPKVFWDDEAPISICPADFL